MTRGVHGTKIQPYLPILDVSHIKSARFKKNVQEVQFPDMFEVGNKMNSFPGIIDGTTTLK